MDDVFARNSIRNSDQLLISGRAPQAVPSRHETSNESWGLDESLEIRREAEGMLHFLLVQSNKVALLIEERWLPNMVTCNFSHEPIFKEVAEAGGCVVHKLSVPDNGGRLHLMFLGRSPEVNDAEYLECVPVRVPA